MPVTIWKFNLRTHGAKRVSMPKGARVLSVQNQGGAMVLWALVNPSAPEAERTFYSAMTGEPFDAEKLEFIGTVQFNNGEFVAHVFEVKP